MAPKSARPLYLCSTGGRVEPASLSREATCGETGVTQRPRDKERIYRRNVEGKNSYVVREYFSHALASL